MNHCLIVDDSNAVRTVAKRILERLDFMVIEAADAQVGLSAYRDRTPDLVWELCWNLGDAVDQAAWLAGISMTSTPFWNLTPWTTLGN